MSNSNGNINCSNQSLSKYIINLIRKSHVSWKKFITLINRFYADFKKDKIKLIYLLNITKNHVPTLNILYIFPYYCYILRTYASIYYIS